MLNTTRYLKRVFRTLLQNADGTEEMVIPKGMAEDTITLGALNWVNSPTRIFCAAAGTQTVVSVGVSYLLCHVHLVADAPLIWRVAEKTGSGEIDFDGDVFIASSGSATLGTNIASITAVNGGATQINIWAHVVIKSP